MIGMEEDEETFLRAVGEGVVGYVLKDASANEVVRVIREVGGGWGRLPASICIFPLSMCSPVMFAFPSNRGGKRYLG